MAIRYNLTNKPGPVLRYSIKYNLNEKKTAWEKTNFTANFGRCTIFIRLAGNEFMNCLLLITYNKPNNVVMERTNVY